MRSEGRVRFIRLSTRLQMQLCAGVAALALGWVGTLATVALLRLHDSFDQQSLLNRAARVESAEKRVGAYRRNLDSVAADLRRRQDFIEKMVEAHVGELPADHRAGETVSDSSTEAGKAVSKISAAVPEAAPLARMEARQLAFAEQLTRWADRRATGETDRLRRLGLNPAMLLAAQNNGEAEGGPLLRLATESDGGLDPRFARLGASLAAGLWVEGDAELLTQLFINLVENAIVHTPVGTAIHIALAARGDRVCATVSDDGPGVDPADHARIFRRFYRCAASKGLPGTGLGLSLVAAIADMHGAACTLLPADRGFALELAFPRWRGG